MIYNPRDVQRAASAGQAGIHDRGADAARGQCRSNAERGVPVFEVDASWPKGLPNNWTFGEFSGVTVDSHDHIWINQRPRTLADDEKYLLATPPIGDCCRPGPSIMEFDQAGNFVQGWGGAGQGFEWPENEHGVYVDDNDNVWVGGNGAKDNHILKFTKTGTFILQIGTWARARGAATPPTSIVRRRCSSIRRRTSCSSPTATAIAA